MQAGVGGEDLHEGGIGLEDVGGLAGERGPAEWALALAEERPDERWHESRNIECVLHAGLPRLGTDVVAVVEDDRSCTLEVEHGANVVRD